MISPEASGPSLYPWGIKIISHFRSVADPETSERCGARNMIHKVPQVAAIFLAHLIYHIRCAIAIES